LKDLSPTKAVKDTVPEEAWHGRKIDVKKLRLLAVKHGSSFPSSTRRSGI
jgi:hypothetical protein